jgi:hypothetical protein
MSKRVTVEGFLSCFLLCCGLAHHLCSALLVRLRIFQMMRLDAHFAENVRFFLMISRVQMTFLILMP